MHWPTNNVRADNYIENLFAYSLILETYTYFFYYHYYMRLLCFNDYDINDKN